MITLRLFRFDRLDHGQCGPYRVSEDSVGESLEHGPTDGLVTRQRVGLRQRTGAKVGVEGARLDDGHLDAEARDFLNAAKRLHGSFDCRPHSLEIGDFEVHGAGTVRIPQLKICHLFDFACGSDDPIAFRQNCFGRPDRNRPSCPL
jgi:hypothetical protein